MASTQRPAPLVGTDEAYRILRSTVKFAGGERAIRSVLVVDVDPPQPTGVAARLAAAFADAGDRTILINADTSATPGAGPGLSDLLAQSTTDDALVAPTGPARLTEIGPGAGLSADLLASDTLATTVGSLVDSGAIVIVSCAPLPTYSDAIAIAPRLDATILVVSAGRTRRARAIEARDALERVGARLLGVTMVEDKRRWFW